VFGNNPPNHHQGPSISPSNPPTQKNLLLSVQTRTDSGQYCFEIAKSFKDCSDFDNNLLTGLALTALPPSSLILSSSSIPTAIMASPTPMDEDKAPEKMSQEAYFDTAIRAVRQKKPAPEIDFTLHTMEDGTQVSTTERVCKGMCFVRLYSPLTSWIYQNHCANFVLQTSKRLHFTHRPKINSCRLLIEQSPISNSSSNISTAKVD
jgi:hypothetical protein